MKRSFVFFILFISILYGSSSIDKKIKRKEKELELKDEQYERMDRKLSKIAKKILRARREKRQLDNKLKVLEKKIRSSQSIYDDLTRKKNRIDKELKKLSKMISDKQKKFADLVADKFSIALVLEELKQPTPKSIMLQETYKIYADKNSKEIDKLKRDIKDLNAKEDFFRVEQARLRKEISVYKRDRDEYLAKKAKKSKILKRLERDKAIYKKRFDKLARAREELQERLNRLKIVKRDKDILADNREAKAKRERASSRVAHIVSKGGKISPLEGSKLIKRFGTYIDPVYKFKVFNKSITLKAPHKYAKVKAILSGKIVFANDTGGMLGKIVIISHAHNIHTIYAKLSRLAPGIHVGKRISKGAVIGKVNSVLMFEVTKNSVNINPVKLIKL